MGVNKTLHIQGTSKTSFNDALNTALIETSKTIEHIYSIQINHLECSVKDNVITEYIVNANISFNVDTERK